MGTVENNNSGATGGAVRPGQLIAKVGSARILRGQDGLLDVSSDTPGGRNAALTWMFTVNPSLFARMRPCTK
jgi:hypothetical protein